MLICPHCQAPLQREAQRFVCEHNHSFDIARQGYVNLLPVNQKRSKNPGDDKAMVTARQQFLESGHYLPLVDSIERQIWQHTRSDSSKPLTFIDAGCGEGYYTDQIHKRISKQTPLSTCGFDISKAAIALAAKREKESITWFVASIKSIPLQMHCADCILSVFSPVQAKPLHTIAAPNATLITLNAGADHLIELRKRLYETITPHESDKLADLSTFWQTVHHEEVKFRFELNTLTEQEHLLHMTPHYWRAKPERKKLVQQGLIGPITAHIKLSVLKPKEMPNE